MTQAQNFTADTVASACAAAIGKRLSLETLKEQALFGKENFEAFCEASRAWFATRTAVPAKRSSFALMQKDKVPGVSTFYTYASKLRQYLKAGNLDAIVNATTKSLTEKKAAPAADTDTSADTSADTDTSGASTDAPAAPAAAAEPAALSVDACIAFLSAAAQSTGLTQAQYVALQALIPMPHVVDMGRAVEVVALQH